MFEHQVTWVIFTGKGLRLNEALSEVLRGARCLIWSRVVAFFMLLICKYCRTRKGHLWTCKRGIKTVNHSWTSLWDIVLQCQPHWGNAALCSLKEEVFSFFFFLLYAAMGDGMHLEVGYNCHALHLPRIECFSNLSTTVIYQKGKSHHYFFTHESDKSLAVLAKEILHNILTIPSITFHPNDYNLQLLAAFPTSVYSPNVL